MEFVIGTILAVSVSIFATAVGFDRERTFYPVCMIVIAGLYGLFAVLGGSLGALATESLVGAGFVLVAVLGFKRNLWWVAGALFAHGVFDFFHRHLISNPGVPVWWPGFCGAYDVVAAGCLAWLLKRSKISKNP